MKKAPASPAAAPSEGGTPLEEHSAGPGRLSGLGIGSVVLAAALLAAGAAGWHFRGRLFPDSRQNSPDRPAAPAPVPPQPERPPSLAARKLSAQANDLFLLGRLAEAQAAAERAGLLFRENGEMAGVAETRGLHGEIFALRGEWAAAERELAAAAADLDAQGLRLASARRRVDLAQVLLDAGRPAKAEEMTQQALASMGRTPAPDDEVAARTVRAAASLARGRNDIATAEIRRTAEALDACESRAVRLRAVIVRARVHSAAGRQDEALRDLRAAQDEAGKLGLRPLILEARLARGQISGAAGRADLAAVAREAAAAGLGGLAIRAGRSGAAPAGPQ